MNGVLDFLDGDIAVRHVFLLDSHLFHSVQFAYLFGIEHIFCPTCNRLHAQTHLPWDLPTDGVTLLREHNDINNMLAFSAS